MKRSRWFFGFVVLGVGWSLLQLSFWSLKNDSSGLTTKQTVNIGEIQIKSAENSLNASELNSDGLKKKVNFEDKFKSESGKVGQLDSNPDETIERLRAWVQVMARDELTKLKVKALNPALNGDDRALAIFLLGLSPRDEAISDLGEIARSEIIESENARTNEFESIFRAQAAENMIRPESLVASRRELGLNIAKSSNPFVIDRSQRGLLSLDQGITPRVKPPSQQDQEALSKLIGPSQVKE